MKVPGNVNCVDKYKKKKIKILISKKNASDYLNKKLWPCIVGFIIYIDVIYISMA